MTFKRDTFFAELADHLSQRRSTVRSLAVMVATERWVQMEAAALLDRNRENYGIGGGTLAAPSWWVTCEHQGVDVWLERPTEGIAIELKAIHNNKNFYAKVAELRADSTPDLKHVPPHVAHVQRVGLLVVTYARYLPDHGGSFAPLRASRRGPPMAREAFLTELTSALADDHAWYGESLRLKLLDLREVASLDGAPYVETGHGASVWLGIVEGMS